MQVTLLSYNPDALNLLLFTKQTRLAQSPGLLEEIREWPMEKKLAELDYMLGTIQSSWEFCDYTFLIDGVTRAFTHQLVRTRQGAYAQQSQRTVAMEGFQYITTGEVLAVDNMPVKGTADHPNAALHSEMGRLVRDMFKIDNVANIYDITMQAIGLGYLRMLQLGVPPQDARGVLPTNITTNIVAKFNLRTLSEMARLRLCTRTQGEYQEVFRAMRKAVIAVHGWAEPFLRVHCAATGVCQFPNYTECPIKTGVFNPDTGQRWDEQPIPILTRQQIQTVWEHTRFEAIPKVRS